MIELLHGDCLERLKELPDNSVDACVTDPPYGLSFMGKAWDYDVPTVDVWREVLRVLKPGGHLLAFAGTRTQHRMAVQIEDAGFEIRDMIAWVYGSGFPKSRNLDGDWQGWGTALKPALEPITVARKPLTGTVATNVLEHSTGAINVDGCRVGDRTGRWPANLIHDGSDEVVGLFPQAKGATSNSSPSTNVGFTRGAKGLDKRSGYADDGSAARFFYCAKASKADRGDGNSHPTVKPTELMRYLCRLVTPPGGVVLDPFMGSGSTGKAAVLEGFRFIGIEREAEYLEIARGRIEVPAQGSLL
jgi:site-specific DNA-methyltransferase (adenine-specific)